MGIACVAEASAGARGWGGAWPEGSPDGSGADVLMGGLSVGARTPPTLVTPFTPVHAGGLTLPQRRRADSTRTRPSADRTRPVNPVTTAPSTRPPATPRRDSSMAGPTMTPRVPPGHETV